MTPGHSTQVDPIALREGEGEALWFLGHLLTIKASGATTGGRMAVIENLAAEGPAAPLHVHRNENEWFYVIEGELTFWVGGTVIVAPKGAFVFAPVGIPHTFSVTSPEARFLLGTRPRRLRGLRAHRRRAGRCARAPSAARRPAGRRASGSARGGVRHRDPRPSGHPRMTPGGAGALPVRPAQFRRTSRAPARPPRPRARATAGRSARSRAASAAAARRRGGARSRSRRRRRSRRSRACAPR